MEFNLGFEGLNKSQFLKLLNPKLHLHQ